jgi:hypothetical protein
MTMDDSELNEIAKIVQQKTGVVPSTFEQPKEKTKTDYMIEDLWDQIFPNSNVGAEGLTTSTPEPTATPTPTATPKATSSTKTTSTSSTKTTTSGAKAYYYSDGSEIKNSSQLLARQQLEASGQWSKVLAEIHTGQATYDDYGLNSKVTNMTEAAYKKYLENCKNLNGMKKGSHNTTKKTSTTSTKKSSTSSSKTSSKKSSSSSKTTTTASDTARWNLYKKLIKSSLSKKSDLATQVSSLKSLKNSRYNEIVAQHKKNMNQYS